MFDLGWTEMMLIGIVALIVVGPKELPGLFRTVGHAVGKARGMAREFSRAMESAADETGLKDIDRTIRAAARPAQFVKGQVRDAAVGRSPLNPGAPLSTDALAAERAEARARVAEEAAARAEERARAAEARASGGEP